MTIHNTLRYVRGAAVAACVLATASCADVARTGNGPVYLIMESVTASAGGGTSFTSSLLSDVQVLVDVTVNGQVIQTPTIFNDLGQATIRAEMKNATLATTPSPLNSITITRYRVVFRRTDGRAVPGVDVPHSFEGAATVTIVPGTASAVNFDLVRHQTKSEAPLRNLIGGGGLQFITTIADVTFYGRDQAGNDITVSGSIDVAFADFGDEDS